MHRCSRIRPIPECTVSTSLTFYSLGEEDGKDPATLIGLDQLGFNVIGWEDSGAHGTISDDYDMPDHFERVEAFASLTAAELPGGRNCGLRALSLLC